MFFLFYGIVFHLILFISYGFCKEKSLLGQVAQMAICISVFKEWNSEICIRFYVLSCWQLSQIANVIENIESLQILICTEN